VAVLAILPEAEVPTATTNAMLAADDPTGRGPGFVQVTTCAAALQLHPVPLPDTNVNCDARVSVTVIVPVVGASPPLLTAKLKA
jgi:hypothetical protein